MRALFYRQQSTQPANVIECRWTEHGVHLDVACMLCYSFVLFLFVFMPSWALIERWAMYRPSFFLFGHVRSWWASGCWATFLSIIRRLIVCFIDCCQCISAPTRRVMYIACDSSVLVDVVKKQDLAYDRLITRSSAAYTDWLMALHYRCLRLKNRGALLVQKKLGNK